MKAPAPRAVAELVRLPAVLSVPGDVLVGAATGALLGRLTSRAARPPPSPRPSPTPSLARPLGC